MFMVRRGKRVVFAQRSCRDKRIDRPEPIRRSVRFEQRDRLFRNVLIGMNDVRDVHADEFLDRAQFLPVPAALDQFHNTKGAHPPVPVGNAGDELPRLLIAPKIPDQHVGIEDHR